MKPHILAINPWFCDFKGYDQWMKPLGLLYVCSFLKNCRISFIDCLNRPETIKDRFGCGHFHCEEIEKPSLYRNIKRKYKRYGIPIAEFRARLAEIEKPDIILITSMMTYWYEGVFLAIRLVKKHFPGVPVVLGGIYAALCSTHAQQHSGADYIVEGSNLEYLGKIIQEHTQGRQSMEKVEFIHYPLPAYELLKNTSSIAITTSLGCPFHCSYCASNLLSKNYQVKPIEQLYQEWKTFFTRHKYNDIAFYDDALLLNYENYLGEFLSRLKSDGIHHRYHTPNALHARYINADRAKHMKAHGFQTIRIGFEFIEEEKQWQTGGKVNSEQAEKAVENLLCAGFQPQDIGLYIMCGIPELESVQIEKAIRTVYEWGAQSRIVEYSPIPRTQLWAKFPHTDSSEAQDPLFHNNTYHIYRESIIPLDEYNDLRRQSKEYNLCLRHK